jgi:6-phosphogluconolactonase
MNRSMHLFIAAALGAAAGPALATGFGGFDNGVGRVYTMTNETDNKLVVFHRLPNGQLTGGAMVDTGGEGSGMGLGSQGAITTTWNGRTLFAVNAGDSTISSFRIAANGTPLLVGTFPSGGQHPVSLTVFGSVLYVLNAGGEVGGVDNISGFYITHAATLVPINGSTQALSADNTMPAQVSFSKNGRFLIVTEKDTNTIDTFTIQPGWVAGNRQGFDSAAATPFGFSFNLQGRLIVSHAAGGDPDASTAATYTLNPDGTLTLIENEATTETAACWVALPRNARFAYTTNTGSGTVTGFRSTPWGNLTLLNGDGVSANTGATSAPIDADVVGNKYLYVLESGDGVISGWRINQSTGALTGMNTVGQLPASVAGLAAF